MSVLNCVDTYFEVIFPDLNMYVIVNNKKRAAYVSFQNWQAKLDMQFVFEQVFVFSAPIL